MVNLSFDIESREYQGRWYTSIRGWKAEKVDPNAPAAPAQAPMPPADAGMPQPAAPSPMSEVPNFSEPQDGDDLPF